MTERVLVVDISDPPNPGLGSVAGSLAGPDGEVSWLCAAPESSAGPTVPADRVLRVSDPTFDRGRGDHWAAAVVAAARRYEPTIILAGPTKVEVEGLARAGALLDAPVLTRAQEPKAVAGGVAAERDLLSGNAVGTETVSGRPILVALGQLPPAGEPGRRPTGTPPIEGLTVELPSYSFRRLALRPKPAGGVNLEAATRIVSVGRGLQRKEDLALVESLAKVLGAEVGCTRPIAADSGWLGDEHWVGLTGHRVRPALYVAVGISGAAQHLVGMRDSKLVLAINKDPNAPIFQQADLQVVGDLYEILPELTQRLEAAKGSH